MVPLRNPATEAPLHQVTVLAEEEEEEDTARHLQCAVVLHQDDTVGDHRGEIRIRIARVRGQDHDRQGRDRGRTRRDLGVEHRRGGQEAEEGIVRHHRREEGGGGGVRVIAVIAATVGGVGVGVGETMAEGGEVDAGRLLRKGR